MVAALKRQRAALPKHGMQGDNHRRIDEQIAIIEGRSTVDFTAPETEEEFGEEGASELQLALDWVNGSAVDLVDKEHWDAALNEAETAEVAAANAAKEESHG